MTRINVIRAVVITLLIFTVCLAVEVNEPNESVIPVVKQPRPKVETVTMVEFYLRDGNAISGKLLSEDKNQVVVELPDESKIVVRSYTKKEIDSRTLTTRPLIGWRYYVRLGDYFAARTWDFVDDPDDFIEAIRCYEKAKQSLLSQGGDSERTAEIDALIEKTRQDKEVWTSQVETRAKLKQLEYQAEAENRLKKLEKQIVESGAKLNESIKALDKTASGIQDDYKRLEKAMTAMNKDFVEQIRILQIQINDNRVLINDLWNRINFLSIKPPAGG
ncbi:MAG: hypothetical protein JW749_12955 [Sedimentisphaerales bacterium]|nr:hypothetical protein [Sedimentisphaerales bacterium]